MSLNIRQLIVVPALISLGVTILRLVGELMHWSPVLFNRAAGGGGALVGISWLVPIFGVYFAIKLIRSGHGPSSAGKVVGFALLGIVAAIILGMGGGLLFGQSFYAPIVSEVVIAVAAIAIVRRCWPELFRTLIAYAFAARIPVAVLMFFAIMGNWGTHYDVPPPGPFPEMSRIAKWFYIGLIPQFTVWIAFTAVVGTLFGGIAAFFAKPKGAD